MGVKVLAWWSVAVSAPSGHSGGSGYGEGAATMVSMELHQWKSASMKTMGSSVAKTVGVHCGNKTC